MAWRLFGHVGASASAIRRGGDLLAPEFLYLVLLAFLGFKLGCFVE